MQEEGCHGQQGRFEIWLYWSMHHQCGLSSKSEGSPALPWQLTFGVFAEAQMVTGRAGSTAATLFAAHSRPREHAPPLSVVAEVLL